MKTWRFRFPVELPRVAQEIHPATVHGDVYLVAVDRPALVSPSRSVQVLEVQDVRRLDGHYVGLVTTTRPVHDEAAHAVGVCGRRRRMSIYVY